MGYRDWVVYVHYKPHQTAFIDGIKKHMNLHPEVAKKLFEQLMPWIGIGLTFILIIVSVWILVIGMITIYKAYKNNS
jgi:hypothetical protein